jgi:folate-binding protein YgfZ
MTLQRSALHFIAVAAGGDLQEQFGWELPRVYTDASFEYRAATEAAAVHDTSYIGRLKATGADALDLLNRMSTNQVLGLEPGQGAPTILTTDRGRILDLLGVVNTGDDVLLLTSPGQQQAVIDWLDKYTIMEDLTVSDITSETTMLTVFGPHSQARLEEATGVGLGQLSPYHTLLGSIGGHKVRIIHRPLGGLPGFDLVLPPDAAPAAWQQLTGAGITPVGLEAYQAVRVRYAVPLYGHEMGDAYNPLEAGLIGSVDFHKGCYIGQEVIARLDTYQKVQKRLVMLRFPAAASAAEGASLEHNGQAVGVVTSVTRIPTTGEVIGLGYVRTASAAVGTRLELAAPATGWAEIEALPQLFGPGEG